MPSSLSALVPYVKSVPITFKKMRAIPKAGYSLYNAQHVYQPGSYRRVYNLVGKSGKTTEQSVFHEAKELPVC